MADSDACSRCGDSVSVARRTYCDDCADWLGLASAERPLSRDIRKERGRWLRGLGLRAPSAAAFPSAVPRKSDTRGTKSFWGARLPLPVHRDIDYADPTADAAIRHLDRERRPTLPDVFRPTLGEWLSDEWPDARDGWAFIWARHDGLTMDETSSRLGISSRTLERRCQALCSTLHQHVRRISGYEGCFTRTGRRWIVIWAT